MNGKPDVRAHRDDYVDVESQEWADNTIYTGDFGSFPSASAAERRVEADRKINHNQFSTYTIYCGHCLDNVTSGDPPCERCKLSG